MKKPNHLTSGQWDILKRARNLSIELSQTQAEIELYYAQKSFTGGDIQTPHLSQMRRELTILSKKWMEITNSREYSDAVMADTL